MWRPYPVTTCNLAEKPLGERIVLWLFYHQQRKLYWWYQRIRDWFLRRKEKALTHGDIERLWKEANQLAIRLDRTQLEITEIHRNRSGDVILMLRSLVYESIDLRIEGRMWGDNTRIFGYEGEVGSKVDATYWWRDCGSYPFLSELRSRPIILNCLILELDRTEVVAIYKSLEQELGPIPEVVLAPNARSSL